MSGGTKWRESKNSPDWTDIFTLMRAIEGLHSVTVFITLSSSIFDGPSGFTTIAAHKTARQGEASVLGSRLLSLQANGRVPITEIMPLACTRLCLNWTG